jgi:hypothetical protein
MRKTSAPRASNSVYALALLGAASVLSGCGGGDAADSSVVATPDGGYQVLSGQVEKGPLLRGSSVTINRLTTAPETLAAGTTTALANTGAFTLPPLVPSGVSFTLEVKDDFGRFVPQSAAIFSSAFIETTAEGYYFNELTGERSDDYIALRGLSNLKSDRAINVNLLTDLSRERTLTLARTAAGSGAVSSAIFDTARRQAQTETLRAFGINAADLGSVASFSEMDLRKLSTETTPRAADQILLALSALAVQIGQDGSGLSDFLNRFETDLADNGVVDDATLKSQILQASAAVDFDRVAANLNRFYSSTRHVSADIAQWVDRSGGTIGLLQKHVQYIPNLAFTPGSSYDSKIFTVAGNATLACYGVEINDSRYGSVALIDGTTAVSSPRAFPTATTAANNLKLRFTPSDPNAVGFLVRWDAVSGACSTTSQANKVKLLAYAAVPSDVAAFLNKYKADFGRCMALPVTSRVLATNNTVPFSEGGATVTSMADACKPLFSDPSRTGIEFLQNGFRAGQFAYSMFTDAAMTRTAKVRDIAILRSSSAASAPMAPLPTLVMSVRYLDRFNRMSSFVTVAQKVAGTSPASGDWSVTGNQQAVDVNVTPLLRKFTSVANLSPGPVSTKEHFRSALGFFISAYGPGSRLPDGRAMSAVRISGSGLPGLVYVPPVQSGQTWMDISNQSGDVAAAASRRCGVTVGADGPTFANCPYLWVARTTTVVPSSAAPVKRIPTSTDGSCASAASVTQTCAWGSTWSAQDISATLVKNAPLTVEVFHGGSTTPTYTYNKYLNVGIADLTRAHLAGWVALDNTSVLAAQPLAGQTSLDLAWTGQVLNQNEVRSATVTLANAAASVATPDDAVARGMNTVTVSPGQQIQYTVPTAYTGATSQRSILLNMRTWDTSSKSLWFSYDTSN